MSASAGGAVAGGDLAEQRQRELAGAAVEQLHREKLPIVLRS